MGSPNHNEAGAVEWFCNMMIKYAVYNGRAWSKMIGNQNVGCAIWQTPFEQTISYWGMISTGFHSAPWKFGLKASWRAMNSLQSTEVVRNELIKESHWYLFSIGVEPEHQNKGYGTQLMLPILRMADKGGLKCYVDTSSQRSLRFFERLGFKQVKEVKGNVTTGEPTYWCMIRNPEVVNNNNDNNTDSI
eukprot:TRINITY_DN1583_c0_g1_i2.p1 TRINITY_DN1583_c0_g1~~TRINITY_DN1583_c0_g1_i2.p1  ORF type:complete len:189 (-),score=33.39 TRINITY_DN1583_c0_g1_i2:42-608(-)